MFSLDCLCAPGHLGTCLSLKSVVRIHDIEIWVPSRLCTEFVLICKAAAPEGQRCAPGWSNGGKRSGHSPEPQPYPGCHRLRARAQPVEVGDRSKPTWRAACPSRAAQKSTRPSEVPAPGEGRPRMGEGGIGQLPALCALEEVQPSPRPKVLRRKTPETLLLP